MKPGRAPAVPGLVLGGMIEKNFMTPMIKSDGNLLAFLERPVAAVLGAVMLLAWAWVLFDWIRRRGTEPPRPAETSSSGA